MTQGVVHGEEVGTGIEVTATLDGFSDSVTIEVTDAESVGLTVSTETENGPTLINADQTLELKATANFTDGSSQDVSGDASWSTSDGDVASVLSGTVTGEGAGQANISALYLSQTGQIQVTVVEAPLSDLVLNQSGNYTFDTTTGVLLDPSSQSVTDTGWDASEGRLILNSLTIGPDST